MPTVVQYLLGVLALGALCAGWMLVQHLVHRVHPDAPGAVRRCGNCGCGNQGGDACQTKQGQPPHH